MKCQIVVVVVVVGVAVVVVVVVVVVLWYYFKHCITSSCNSTVTTGKIRATLYFSSPFTNK